MLDKAGLNIFAMAGNKENSTPLTFLTGLKYDTDVIKALNNITFIYDPNWAYESQNPTYPIAFFYVKKMEEEMQSEISQKPMLFYNTSNSNDSVSAGLINIVADNVIIKPKTYKLDILVPMNIDNFLNTGRFSNYERENVRMFTFENTLEKTFNKDNIVTNDYKRTMSIVGKVASVSFDLLKTLFTTLYGAELNVSSLLTKLLEQEDYNKNSIDYMWRNRRILKLKMWNGWQFKYLVIKDFNISKEGELGNFYEGTLTCQEMPIMTIKSDSILSSLSILGNISSLLGKGMSIAVDTFIKGMEATAGKK